MNDKPDWMPCINADQPRDLLVERLKLMVHDLCQIESGLVEAMSHREDFTLQMVTKIEELHDRLC